MVSAVPHVPLKRQVGRRVGGRGRMLKRRVRKKGSGVKGTERAVKKLPLRAVKRLPPYIDVAVPPPRPPSETKPRGSTTAASLASAPAGLPLEAPQDNRQSTTSSFYIDLTENSPFILPMPLLQFEEDPKHLQWEKPVGGPHNTSTHSLHDFAREWGPLSDAKSSSRGSGIIHCKADVHHSMNEDPLSETMDSTGDGFLGTDVKATSHRDIDSNGTFQIRPLSHVQLASFQPRKRTWLYKTPEKNIRTSRQPPGDRRQSGNTIIGCSGHSENLERSKENACDTGQYMQYSPDTYYQSRGGFTSFKPA